MGYDGGFNSGDANDDGKNEKYLGGKIDRTCSWTLSDVAEEGGGRIGRFLSF